MSRELWKTHPDYPGYLISVTGKVKSVRTGREIYRIADKSGYIQVHLWSKGVRKTWRLHRLVAAVWCKCFHPDKEVHHKNGKTGDNHAKNLFCCTRAEHVAIRMKNAQKTMRQLRKKYGKDLDEIFVTNIITGEFNVAYCLKEAAKYGGCCVEMVKQALELPSGIHPLHSHIEFNRF